MEKSRKVRSVRRTQFSKLVKNLEGLLDNVSEAEISEVKAIFMSIKDIHADLKTLDDEIIALLTSEDSWEEKDLEKEYEVAHKYDVVWAIMEGKYTEVINNCMTVEKKPSSSMRRIKLPMLEMKKFDGSIKNWLSFWGQFNKIHENPEIDNIDKYQYLSQSMEQGTDVKIFVDSFPTSNDSYDLCLKELKSRYAREDLLIEMYVRELLNLIIKRDTNFDLTSIYDNINSHLRSLEVLGVTKNKYSIFLLPMIESALPVDILKIWERTRQIGAEDGLESLMTFLKKEVESEQRIGLASNFQPGTSKHAATCLMVKESTKEPASKYSNNNTGCLWCDKQHTSLECYSISKLSIEQRREHLKKKKACALCLKIGHHAKVCKSYIKCYVCSLRHSPVLCPGKTSTTVQNFSAQNKLEDTREAVTLLQTVTAKLCFGQRVLTVRALLDSGSQRSYVKEDIAQQLGIPSTGTLGLSHSLFGGNVVEHRNYDTYKLKVKNLDNSFEFEMFALSQNTICNNVPQVNIKAKNLVKFLNENKIVLTDIESRSLDIGLLIGADYLGFLLTNTILTVSDGLMAIKTNLGWTLQGKTKDAIVMTNMTTTLFCSQNINTFWKLELLGIQDPVEIKNDQQREEDVINDFEENILTNNDGRYEVQLPWRTGYDDILSNRELAMRRLESNTKKLVASGKYRDYDLVLRDWERAGIIEAVPDNSCEFNKALHYLPHRAVIKESSLTTKIRPVFDASARDKNGKSLNACLDKGVNMLDKIPNLLIGFRRGCIGISADIAKAFLQISVRPDDRDYLRFLWWRDERQQDVMVYRHCRVVFGLTSSPFLLSATIQHHLRNIQDYRKNTAGILASSFYVDNVVTSLETVQDTERFIEEAKNIMLEAKFDLRQWVTSPMKLNDTDQTTISILGVMWDTVTDELFCNLKALPNLAELGTVSKRVLLSITQRFYDPIGMFSPVTLVPRLLMKLVWDRKITWDEQVPHDILIKFYDWYENIFFLNDCRLPRQLSVKSLSECMTNLHLFCDASKDGYAACVFLRTEDTQGKVAVRLVCAKSRITPPNNKITIPRLELLAAMIGSRLLLSARTSLNLKNCQEFCWTDSGVTLCWIKRELPWNTYVGNRVKEIRVNTDVNSWYHISGINNWADLASRGCNASQLLETRWWEGPKWLYLTTEQWPQSNLVIDEKEANRELKKTACVNICIEDVTNRLNYFSRYSKIVRMVAWMLRFVYNSRNKNKTTGELSYDEFSVAEKKIFFIIQRNEEEIIMKHTKRLVQFCDEDKLIRIKTKLLLTDMPDYVKSPVVIPAKNFIVQKMVEQRHVHLLHAGTNIMITDLRKRFWIIGIRKLVKSVINNCIVCKRHRAKATEVTTAPLPIERVQATAPFEVTGVDLAGPIYLRNGEKCWIVVYTCAVYRAIHLELTQSLSTEAFLKTLRRFIARRGRVKTIISDNGTNFIGAKNLLSSVDWDEVKRVSTIMQITWKLNAPSAPWWGGFFERLIRMIKNLLRRVLGMSSVTYDEMETLLCDCEAVMNSRPLTYVDGDDTDALEPLKPSHFLQALQQSDVTDLDVIDTASMNKRLRYLQRLRDDFRQRFQDEYLTELVQRGKEKKSIIKVGDIVLVESEEKRVKWPLGMVVEIYAGRDGVERTAKVKTSTGFKVRPFQRLYKLELHSSEVEEQSKDKTTRTRSGRKIVLPSRYKI